MTIPKPVARLPWNAALVVTLLLAGCAAQQPEVPPPVGRKVQPAPVPRVAPSSLGEEKLGGETGPAIDRGSGEANAVNNGEGIAPVEPVPPPDPQTIVASIGPSTSPQLAASLRLTDEGRLLLENGNATAALDRIEKAVKIDPSNPHGYYWLAQVHYHNRRLDQALAFTDKSIVLFAQSDRTWLGQAYTFRASILEQAGRFRDARDSYRRAVQAQPGNVAARAGLARLGDPASSPQP